MVGTAITRSTSEIDRQTDRYVYRNIDRQVAYLLVNNGVEHCSCLKPRQHSDTGTDSQRAEQAVHDPVCMVEGEHVEQSVVRGPLPGMNEATSLAVKVPMAQHNSLRQPYKQKLN